MYKKLYFMMFNRMTDAVNAPKEGRNDDALRALQSAQEEAEQIFIENGEDGKKKTPPVLKTAQGIRFVIKSKNRHSAK